MQSSGNNTLARTGVNADTAIVVLHVRSGCDAGAAGSSWAWTYCYRHDLLALGSLYSLGASKFLNFLLGLAFVFDAGN